MAIPCRLRSAETAVLEYTGLRAWDARGRVLSSKLQVGQREIRLLVDDGDAQYPVVVDPLWTQQAELTAPSGDMTNELGTSIALSGNTAVVGTLGKGTAYVFVQNGTTWSLQAKLTDPGGSSFSVLGPSVAISGDTVVIGDPNAGAGYVYVRSGTSWTPQQTLAPSDGASALYFSWSVAVDGDTVVVGSPGNANLQGAAYVFVRSGATWSQQQKLTASDGAQNDDFGYSVTVSGNTAAVGAPAKQFGSNPNQGAAYVFVRNGSTWTQQQVSGAAPARRLHTAGCPVAVARHT